MAGGKITDRGTEIRSGGVHFAVMQLDAERINLSLMAGGLVVSQAVSPRVARDLTAALIRQADAVEKAAEAA